MTQAIRSQGSTLELGDGATPEVFTAIAEVRRIKPGTATATKIFVTHLTSSGPESVSGFVDYAPLDFSVNLLPGNTQHIALRTAQGTGADLNFKLKGPSGTPTLAFTAKVETFEIDELTPESAWSATIGLALQGAYTWS
jgi:hypothetical protein